jgi:hypothetical protein
MVEGRQGGHRGVRERAPEPARCSSAQAKLATDEAAAEHSALWAALLMTDRALAVTDQQLTQPTAAAVLHGSLVSGASDDPTDNLNGADTQ